MHIVAVSDLHGWLPGRVPACDLLLIAGDVCPDVPGTANRARLDDAAAAQADWLRERFAPWADSVPAREIVMCWGNHDYIGERPALSPALPVRVLNDQECAAQGLRIYATPWTHLQPDVWAFDVALEKLAERMQAIPEGLDILMTHGPARGVLDRVVDGTRAGSTALAEAVTRMRPRLHIFGHIHEARGQSGSSYNVSVLDVQYRPYPLPLTEIDFAVHPTDYVVVEARHVRDYVVWLKFGDGKAGEVDLGPELRGEVFEPLKDLEYFRSFRLDPELETIAWPNGADFAPEFLHDNVWVTT